MKVHGWLALGAMMAVACGGGGSTTDDGGGVTDGGGADVDGGTPQDGGGGSDSGLADVTQPDGGAPDAGADAAAFAVANVPGLALWLDASKGITKNAQNLVSQWNDQSGNANHAKQATAAQQPTAVANVINGLPMVRFAQGTTTGRELTIADSATLRWSTGDYLIEVVARFNNAAAAGATGPGLFYAKFPTGQAGVIFNGNNTSAMPITAGLSGGILTTTSFVGVTSAYNDNTARLLAYQRAGTVLALRVNGAQVATYSVAGSPTNVDATGAVVQIGSDYTATQSRLNGDIAEMIAVKGTVSAQDLAGIEGYLMGRYAL